MGGYCERCGVPLQPGAHTKMHDLNSRRRAPSPREAKLAAALREIADWKDTPTLTSEIARRALDEGKEE